MPNSTAIAERGIVSDLEILHELNEHYIRSVEHSDTRWFEANLAQNFFNSNPDRTLVDRAGFLQQIGKKSLVTKIVATDVSITVLDNLAVVRARTTYKKPDGQEGTGHYMDHWRNFEGRWLCVYGDVTRD